MTIGIHHITAISSDPQKTYDFYSKILGLRLVKKTVNQDDTETYHLFFGDKYGHPGMDLTFFTFQPSRKGKRGSGFVTKISFTVLKKSLSFWKERFIKFNVKFEEIGNSKLVFYDGDDQRLELVGLDNVEDSQNIWVTNEIIEKNAIRSFYSATLNLPHISYIEEILVSGLGYKLKEQIDNYYIFEIENSNRASIIEVEEDANANYGISGAGTVHHIAFRAKDLDEELQIRSKLIQIGVMPTEVIDRYYFQSAYFRTQAGILFEIATDEPGFTADEDESTLGQNLSLPPFLEKNRKDIESNLTPIIT